jgi:transglutaminase-like putative cysteine protease
MKIILLLAFASLFNVLTAQDINDETRGIVRKQEISITLAGATLKVMEHNYEKVLYSNAINKNRFADKSIYFSEFEKITSLEAYTLYPYKNKIKKAKVEEVSEKDVLQRGIFYGGFKRKNFVFPSVVNNATTVLQYDKSISEPRLINPFYFNSELATDEVTYKVIAPTSVEVSYKLFGNNLAKIKFDERIEAGNKVYTWTYKNAARAQFEKNAPQRSYYHPHIAVYIKSYQVDGRRIKVLGSVADLYQWYQELIKNINNSEGAKLKKIALEITHGISSEEEKVKTIYQWVQTNIKYIAFEDGLHGFIPREAEEILVKKYGDCKDMANILSEMLRAVDINAHLTWIGTRKKPYSYLELPTTVADNHMIATVRIDDQYVFLDATGSYIPYGFPSPMIQGKEALIGISENEHEIVKVPEISMQSNQINDDFFISLQSGNLIISGKTQLSGFQNLKFDYKYLSEGESKRDQLFSSFLGRGNEKIYDLNIEHEGIFNNNQNVELNYSFKIDDYYKEIGDKIYFKAIFFKDLPGELVKLEERNYPIENEFKYINTSRFHIEVPNNYQVEHLPVKSTFAHEQFGFSIAYALDDTGIEVTLTEYKNFLILNAQEFKAQNELIHSLIKSRQENIILNKI